VYFDPVVSIEEKIIFSKYVHEHLLQHARDVERLRHYVCPQCGTPVGNREVAMKRLGEWLRNRPADANAGAGFKFRKAKADAPTIVCSECEKRVSLWDDMEIEFKDDRYEATGQKIYLQLKSGDSYLRERKGDGAEIFTIKDERHARYWMAQAFPVLLVVRTSEGEVRWMEVRDWLKRESDNGKKPVRQIIFVGERFDVMSVRRWRDKVLQQGSP
jgi:hypothetical protein